MKKILLPIVIVVISCTSKDKVASTELKDSTHQTMDNETFAPVEETEEEETVRLAKEKFEEDEKAFKELGIYDGLYRLHTESDGVEGTLTMKYSGDKVFNFKLELMALDICESNMEGEVTMDRTQHGIYGEENCLLHFNFMGSYADGTIIEIEQPETCDRLSSNCTFTGTYTLQP